MDKGLFLQQNYTELVFGGANIDSVKISSRKKTGEKIEIKKNNSNNLILDIFEKPYIEFSYKKRFYSLEIVSENSGNSFICIIKNINEPTLNLLEVR
ncbi:hypothetical protein [Chishuiella sp.]|uniref:hypothetical protein n=1 Tax=Chishuiella sp. TaxID=1969467 RepID=UPI0028B1D446|nr:hypothetical protein [Chishuiella sp.]